MFFYGLKTINQSIFVQESLGINPEMTRLPELTKTFSSTGGSLKHRDLISQAILERILIFTCPRAMEDGADPSNGFTNELLPDNITTTEEWTGGSGPSSLGSLSLSFPQQMSLSSSSAGGSGKWCF